MQVLHGKTNAWATAGRDLSTQKRIEVGLRTSMQLVPGGFGAAIAEAYWGTIEARWQDKVNETIKHLEEHVHIAEDRLVELTEYWRSHEFASLLESIVVKLRAAAQAAKLAAIRGALVSVVTATPDLTHDRREFFLGAVDRMGPLHFHVLQLFHERMDNQTPANFIDTASLIEVLFISAPEDEEFLVSALDVLANFRFIMHGNVPRQGTEGAIDVHRQRFRCTHLGSQFLEFIRVGEVDN